MAAPPSAATLLAATAPTAPRPTTVVYAFLDLADGGAQRLTLGHCMRLDRTRFRPEILCARGQSADIDDGSNLIATARAENIPLHTLGRLRRPYDFAAVGIIASHLRAISPRIVHVPLYSRAAPYVRLAARLAGVPLVIAHEWSRARPPSSARRVADRILQPGTRFIAVSEHHALSLIADGVSPADICVVHDGVDTVRFCPQDRDEARVRLGLPVDRPIALVPARLHPAKGHADLIAAMPAILRGVPDILVLCAGDGPLRDRLPLAAAAAGLSASNIRFLGQRHDMPQLLAASDIVVLPSHVEGLPSAMLEAFASARPVVATDVGGVSEALVDGETGRLVPARDPEALARAICEVLADFAQHSARSIAVEQAEPADVADLPARSNVAEQAESADLADAARPSAASITRSAMGARGRALALERYRAEDSTRRLEAVYEAWL